MAKTIGIDLGTSHCAVAAMDSGQPQIIHGPNGEATTPTVVAFSYEAPLFGTSAVSYAADEPTHAVRGFTRLLGRKFHAEGIDWLASGQPCPIVASANGDALVHVAGRDYSPEEICSFMLGALKQAAEQQLGDDVQAVLTVPSSFDELARRALLDAAQLAGLPVVALMNTGTAAALTCGVGLAEPRQFAAVLMGAGIVEVCLAEVEESSVRVIGCAGQPMLGGDDLDTQIAFHWAEQLRDSGGIDLTDNALGLAQVVQAARTARHALTDRETSDPVTLQSVYVSEHERSDVDLPPLLRDQLPELIGEDLDAMTDPCRWAFEDAGLGTADFSAIITFGGMTRMPAMAERLTYLFERKPMKLSDDGHVCALGAARYGASLGGHGPEIHVQDVLGSSVGIKLPGGGFGIVVPRNNELPCTETATFKTARKDQERLVVELFQGESDRAVDNLYLGRCDLVDVASGSIEVNYQLDGNGLLQLMASGGEVARRLAGGLTEHQKHELLERRHVREVAVRVDPVQDVTLSQANTLVTKPLALGQRRARDGILFKGDGAPSQLREDGGPLAAGADTRMDAHRHEPLSVEMDADSLVGTTVGGRYLVESIIGEGGMGRVYLARHNVLKKQFAIKVLHPSLAKRDEISGRFVREARAASSIDSDYIVGISDFGNLEDGVAYYVMDYIPGKTLRDEITEGAPLPPTDVVSIGTQTALGLSEAHERNIVHRDLKPSNILVTRRPGMPIQVKILDFGIAKCPTADSSVTPSLQGKVMGTPHYMSPEQVRSEAVDGRSDIYTLGIVLYEMSTGSRPFEGDAPVEIMAQQMFFSPPPVRESGSGIRCSAELEAIIDRCMLKEPEKRYQSARELAHALALC